MFKPGKKYLMKNGQWFHVATTEFPSYRPIMGWDEKKRVTFRTKRGTYWIGKDRPDGTDLTTKEIDPPNQSQASQSLKNNQKPL